MTIYQTIGLDIYKTFNWICIYVCIIFVITPCASSTFITNIRQLYTCENNYGITLNEERTSYLNEYSVISIFSWRQMGLGYAMSTNVALSVDSKMDKNFTEWTFEQLQNRLFSNSKFRNYFCWCILVRRSPPPARYWESRTHCTPWVAIQAFWCAWRVDRIFAMMNAGVSLHPSCENDGRVMPPGTIAVLLQDIPGEKGSLLIRYLDLARTMYWVSLVGTYETCHVPVSTNESF